MLKFLRFLLCVPALLPCLSASRPASAQITQLLINGGFETGNLNGWTQANQNAADKTAQFFANSGTTTPGEQYPTVGAKSGTFYATMGTSAPSTDGPGHHALLQSFTVPTATTSLTLSFDMFVSDYIGEGALNTASGALDYTQSDPTFFGRVDILSAGAGAFDTSATSVVQSLYLGVDSNGDGTSSPPAPYSAYSFDLLNPTSGTALAAGETYQLRFGNVSNHPEISVIQGVDNVSITAVPEPGTGALALLSSGVLAMYQRRRYRHRRHTALQAQNQE